MSLFFFFFNDTATTEIYTLSLHDALPISTSGQPTGGSWVGKRFQPALPRASPVEAAVLNRLAHVLGLQSRRAIQVSDRAGDLEDAGIGPRRQAEPRDLGAPPRVGAVPHPA